MRVLLIEDEPKLAELLASFLKQEGICVDTCASAMSADELLANIEYDAVLLDLCLPDQDGLTLLQTMRSNGPNVPVLITSARADLNDRLSGLNLGADDYLTKPFDPREMIARLRALIRRPGGRLATILTVGNLELDTTSRNVNINGSPLLLTRREFHVLELLMRSSGRVIPKAILEDKIYGIDDEPGSNPVPVHIHNLRKRLSDAGALVEIFTVRGVGYVLKENSRC